MTGTYKNKLLTGALSLSLLPFTFAGAQSSANAAFMETGKLTSIPVGHYHFCNEAPQECNTKTRGDVRVQLNANNWRQLLEVNHFANTSVASITDADLYGTEEHWTYPTNAGDCEDYVLLKRRMLIDRGWPEASLLITVVRQRNGEGHAVLTVRTDRGDLILDNLEQTVKLWNETPYEFIKRQSKNHTGKWEIIKDKRA